MYPGCDERIPLPIVNSSLLYSPSIINRIVEEHDRDRRRNIRGRSRRQQSATTARRIDRHERTWRGRHQTLRQGDENRPREQEEQASTVEQFKGTQAAATFRCVICNETQPVSGAVRPADWGHASCFAYLRAYWTHSIISAKNPRPRCPQPGCELHAPMSALRQVLPIALARQASILLVLRLLPDSEYAQQRHEMKLNS